jgi:hypothetical protein
MTLKLTSALRREIEIDGEPFTVLVSADGVRLTRKRFRSGRTLSWAALWQHADPEEMRGESTTGVGDRRADAPGTPAVARRIH